MLFCVFTDDKIIYINKPEEMEMAHNLIDRNKDTFFKLCTLAPFIIILSSI